MGQIDRLRLKRKPGFWMTYNDIWMVDGLDPVSYTLYSYLLHRAHMHDAVFPNQETIAKMCWTSVPSVKRKLAVLVEKGLLEIERRPGKSNVYWVTDPDLSK